MKRIARGFAALAAVLALSVGAIGIGAEPAAATTLAPYQYTQPITWFGCTVYGVYGNYGAGFAQITMVGSGCSGYTAVQVATTQGYYECNLIAAVFAPSQYCGLIFSTSQTDWQVTFPGTAWGMTLSLSPDAYVPPPYANPYRPSFTAFG